MSESRPVSRFDPMKLAEEVDDIGSNLITIYGAMRKDNFPGPPTTLVNRLVKVRDALRAVASEKPAQEDRALNLLRGLHKVVLDLAPHFEKPITDDNVTRWLALNSAQAAVKEFLK